MEQRPVGIFVAALGAVGIVVAALADPWGLGEGHVFGWLQITGVVLGAVVLLIGLALAMEMGPGSRIQEDRDERLAAEHDDRQRRNAA